MVHQSSRQLGWESSSLTWCCRHSLFQLAGFSVEKLLIRQKHHCLGILAGELRHLWDPVTPCRCCDPKQAFLWILFFCCRQFVFPTQTELAHQLSLKTGPFGSASCGCSDLFWICYGCWQCCSQDFSCWCFWYFHFGSYLHYFEAYWTD